jgi:hypothetical protein
MDLYLCEPVGPFHTAAGAAFNNFTTRKSVDPLPVPVIPGGKLRRGTGIHLKAFGEYSTVTTPTMRIGFWFGSRALAITGDLAVTALAASASGAATWPWWMEWDGICTLEGTAGTLLGQGQAQFGTALGTFAAEIPMPITQALRTVASFDTTIERAIGVSCEFGTAAAGNQIIVNRVRALILN